MSDQAVNLHQRILNVEEAMEVLNQMGFRLTRRIMQEWIAKKYLPFFKQGRRWYITRQSLMDTIVMRQGAAEKEMRRNDRNKGNLDQIRQISENLGIDLLP